MKILFNIEAEEDCLDLAIAAEALHEPLAKKVHSGDVISIKRAWGRHSTRVSLNRKHYVVEFALFKDKNNEYDQNRWTIRVQKITLDDVHEISDDDLERARKELGK